MLANDLTLNPGSFGGVSANKIFVLAGYPTPTSSIRRVQSTALTTPESILVSHQVVQRGGLTIDRHLLRHDVTLNDSLKGSVKASAWTTLEIPRGTTVFTNAVAKDMYGRTVSALLASGVFDAFLAGES
jgi:hypothetical protein